MTHTGIKEKQIRIGYTQGDMHGNLTMGNALRIVQQITMEHCDELGYGSKELLAMNRAFVLARLQIDVQRLPVQGEWVKVVTMAYGPKRLVYQRVTEIRTPEDEVLLSVDSRWTLLDTTTWRITRDTVEGLVEKMLPVQDCDEIRMPKVEFAQEKPPVNVRYSMLDINGHVNNAVYADWTADALAEELISGKKFKRLLLHYNREARIGAEVKMQYACEGGVHYLRGEHEGGQCFAAAAELE